MPFRLVRWISRAGRSLTKNENSRYGEIARYIVAGLGTIAFNYLLFLLLFSLGIDYKAANLVSIVGTKVFAYFINKIYVFRTEFQKIHNVLLEIMRFVMARISTGLIDYLGLIVLVELLHAAIPVSKVFLIIATTALNYILSKKTVFVHETSAPSGFNKSKP
jgi:putative flippase GtrA